MTNILYHISNCLSKKETQLDIAARSSKASNTLAGGKFLIGSCKYKNELTGTSELNLIRNYASLFTTDNDEAMSNAEIAGLPDMDEAEVHRTILQHQDA